MAKSKKMSAMEKWLNKQAKQGSRGASWRVGMARARATLARNPKLVGYLASLDKPKASKAKPKYKKPGKPKANVVDQDRAGYTLNQIQYSLASSAALSGNYYGGQY